MASEAERHEVPLRDRRRGADLRGRKLIAPRPDSLVGSWVDGGQVISPAPGRLWRLWQAGTGELTVWTE